jgi:uncharacterized protein YjbJ (UPF0337 family)
MGLLDDLKAQAGDLGEKAKQGLGTAKDKASDLIDDVKDKFDGDDEVAPTAKVEEAVNYSPGTDDASAGINEAVENATLAAEESAPPADAVDSPVGVNTEDLKADSDSA